MSINKLADYIAFYFLLPSSHLLFNHLNCISSNGPRKEWKEKSQYSISLPISSPGKNLKDLKHQFFFFNFQKKVKIISLQYILEMTYIDFNSQLGLQFRFF